MTLSNKCPKCGAAFAHRDFFGWCTFECGTTLLFNGEVRWEGHECFTRQLAQSQAEVNELNNLLRAAGWGQGEIDNAAAVVDEVEAKLATAQAENAQYAHDFKALRGAMGCDGSDVPQLVAAWDKAQAENERLRAGYQRSKYESAPCPGCEWDNGKLVKLCALHARIAALEAELKGKRRRIAGSDSQAYWLSAWCKKITGVENNAVVGRAEWPNRLVEVVAQAVDARIAALEAELAAWPRVYFTSMNPKSLTEGCRVLSVQGHEGDGWFDVTIDADGEEIQAPTDFGLYRTREEAARAAKGEAE